MNNVKYRSYAILIRDGAKIRCAPWVLELSEQAQEELYRPLSWDYRRDSDWARKNRPR